MIKEAGYKGEAITFRVLSSYYINQVATARVVEMWKAVGLNVQIKMVENWTQIFERGPERGVRDWSNSATSATPSPRSWRSTGPTASSSRWASGPTTR